VIFKKLQKNNILLYKGKPKLALIARNKRVINPKIYNGWVIVESPYHFWLGFSFVTNPFSRTLDEFIKIYVHYLDTGYIPKTPYNNCFL
jgi:hypothetical protein